MKLGQILLEKNRQFFEYYKGMSFNKYFYNIYKRIVGKINK